MAGLLFFFRVGIGGFGLREGKRDLEGSCSRWWLAGLCSRVEDLVEL
jgi:hypothetical protein